MGRLKKLFVAALATFLLGTGVAYAGNVQQIERIESNSHITHIAKRGNRVIHFDKYTIKRILDAKYPLRRVNYPKSFFFKISNEDIGRFLFSGKFDVDFSSNSKNREMFENDIFLSIKDIPQGYYALKFEYISIHSADVEEGYYAVRFFHIKKSGKRMIIEEVYIKNFTDDIYEQELELKNKNAQQELKQKAYNDFINQFKDLRDEYDKQEEEINDLIQQIDAEVIKVSKLSTQQQNMVKSDIESLQRLKGKLETRKREIRGEKQKINVRIEELGTGNVNENYNYSSIIRRYQVTLNKISKKIDGYRITFDKFRVSFLRKVQRSVERYTI